MTIKTHLTAALLLLTCYVANAQSPTTADGIISIRDAQNIILKKATNTSGQLYLGFYNADSSRRGYLGYASPAGAGNSFFISNDDGSPTIVNQRLFVNGVTADNNTALLVNGHATAVGFIARQQTGIHGNRVYSLADGLGRDRFAIGFRDVEGGSNTGSNFSIFSYNDNGDFVTTNFTINRATGNVGIGTTEPGDYKLAVEGTIGARKVKVTTQQPWADFVFDPAYTLPSLKQVEAHIRAYRHLPGIPSANEITKNGLDIGDMQQKQMQKIEELMLYVIDLNKKLELQQQTILEQGKELEELRKKKL
ncbi:hypothetical protein [Chitinophaga niabensis]|uniref:Uncharacterized protein n=1 Tax=Chitinophaga niabensis TaxID=536979 RepID=A0A1N6JWY8_9BACT|nr:hypothetical protein [Chitinophaga niabensis]SIO48878.1 hypothetical protein SAMN04488055_4617 [Chitinophaga niabensis]